MYLIRKQPLLSVAVLTGAFLYAGCSREKTGQQPPQMPPQEVTVVTLKPETVQIETELPGRTSAFRIAEVRPQVSGIVLKRSFTEGGEVKEGEQLYQIDPATYQAATDSAKAAVEKAEAAAHVAELVAARRKKLVETKVVSREDYDDAEAAYKQALADVAASKAALAAADINLVYTKVLSPIAGIIGRSTITEGALVTSGQANALAVVQQLDPIYVDVTQASAQLLRLRRELATGLLKNSGIQETKAKLILEDGSEYSEVGKLQFSEVSVNESTGSVLLRAVFPNPQRQLLPGMFVRAIVAEGEKENAILVPQQGVTRNPRGEPTALVVNTEDKVELRVLKTDRAVGDHWLVTEGVQAGDRVIVEGLQKTAPGAVVKPIEKAEEKSEK